ncbi:MAG: zinc-dependent peptidase [Sphingobacteriales bacterium]
MISPFVLDVFFFILIVMLLVLQTRPGKKYFLKLVKKPLEKILGGDFKLIPKDTEGVGRSYYHYHNSALLSLNPQLPHLLYEGQSLHFSPEEYVCILNKRNIFFTGLSGSQQDIFIERVNHFIHNKRFIIHDEKGFQEMPILISATAVQLTFGLKEYLLPCFNEIHIYPDAFIGLSPLRVLIGNVSGHTINISWKHFLQGLEKHDDNTNVGLHEMAHALYYQNMIDKIGADEVFADSFPRAGKVFDEAFAIEKCIDGLYSEYATRNFQEFWAESIEIFFENPGKLRSLYPQLFDSICNILNLNPLNAANPVLS